jgi:metal-responsive CopG/Arc/MetJ family transcriptional regulator
MLRLTKKYDLWYDSAMKLAVSIPDPIFAEAEAFAKNAQTSRSRLYSRALAEFMARHAPDKITTAMDRVIEAVGQEDASFRHRAARNIAKRNEW